MPNPNLSHAERVIEAVRLRSIRLIETSAKNSRLPRESEELSLFLKQSVEAPTTLEKGVFNIVVTIGALVSSSEKDELPPFETSASFEACYSIPEDQDFSPAELMAFARTNAVFNVWPFAREHIQSMTARMNLPPVVLPLFRLPKTTTATD